MKVKIFSTSGCPYCQMMKGYLTEKKIEFEEKLVDKDPNAKQEMAQVSDGFIGVPFAVITKDDGTEAKIKGFDQPKIDQALGID